MITIIGKTIAGRMHTFNNVLLVEYNADRDIPCDSFDFVAAFQAENDEFCEITATLSGVQLFWGIVDTSEITIDSSGKFIKISCRNITARLVDNEVKPNIYARLTSAELVERYAKPFGIVGSDLPFNASQWLLQVKKGMSNWAVIEEFCRINYNTKPYITRARRLCISPVTNVNHIFSNVGVGIRYSSLDVKHDYFKLISRVNMRTGADNGKNYYGFCVDNPTAVQRKVLRERCYHPVESRLSMNPIANAAIQKNLNQSSARQIISDSILEYFSIIITLPVLMDIQVGDTVSIRDSFIRSDKLFVSSVKLKVNKNGVGTVIVLRERV